MASYIGEVKELAADQEGAVSKLRAKRYAPKLRQASSYERLAMDGHRDVSAKLAAFYSADEARRWLKSKHEMLNNERAIDLIMDGRIEEVLVLIDAIESSVFT
jgi:hypothetical protein